MREFVKRMEFFLEKSKNLIIGERNLRKIREFDFGL